MATLTPTQALHTYQEALPGYEHLANPTNGRRAVAAIDRIKRNWHGPNPVEALAAALGVSRGTIHQWLTARRHIPPEQAWRVAVAYCAGINGTRWARNPGELARLERRVRLEAGTVFDLLYEKDAKLAADWLTERNPTFFRHPTETAA